MILHAGYSQLWSHDAQQQHDGNDDPLSTEEICAEIGNEENIPLLIKLMDGRMYQRDHS